MGFWGSAKRSSARSFKGLNTMIGTPRREHSWSVPIIRGWFVPGMMGTLHECSRRGVPIIVFNPLKEHALERFADPQNPIEMGTFGSTPIASTYHQVKVGGDAAALKGVMKAIMDAAETNGDALDHDFIAEHTNGFAEFAADLRRTEWADIEQACGLV